MKKHLRRNVDLVVISDVHLGTYGCRSKELLNYLKSIQPERLVLNGDIIDIWQFSKRYFPKSHLKIIKCLTAMLAHGTKIYYITGNHDEMLRKFEGFKLSGFEIRNKLILNLDGKKAWIFHGDIFDHTIKNARWLAKLGGFGYDSLILLNTFVNWISEKMGKGKISLSKNIKNGVKRALEHINQFEESAANIAIDNQYHYVVCGHIHQPKMRTIKNDKGQQVMYLNSGDWIENLTSLEYHKKTWKLYKYAEDSLIQKQASNDMDVEMELAKVDKNSKELYMNILDEMYTKSAVNQSKEL